MNVLKPVLDLFGGDWLVFLLLLAWSVAGVTVIFERIYALWRIADRSSEFAERVFERIRKGEVAQASVLCEESSAPIARVFERGLRFHPSQPAKVADALGSQRAATLQDLKRRLWLLATVGSSAPFVGLLGTVIGIIRAFQSMSTQGMGGFKVVSAGLSQALVATAAGLIVAIYALVAYNWFVARLNALAQRYRLLCDDLIVVLEGSGRGDPV